MKRTESAGTPSNHASTGKDSVVVRRQIGGITSIRISNNESASNSKDDVVRRQIGGFTSIRTFNNAAARDATINDNNNESAVKRRKTSNSTADDDNRLQRENQQKQPLLSSYYHPTTLVTWNCNGFSTRAKYNEDLLFRLVEETQTPDMIFIQEARLKAAGPGDQRGKPLNDKDYHDDIQRAIHVNFRQYTPFWSLADKKYAGTLTLVRNIVLEAGGTHCTDNAEGRYDLDFVAFTPSSAIDLMLRRLGTTRAECGLDEETEHRTAGAAAVTAADPSPKKKQQQQTSLKSFFAPKKKAKPDTDSALSPSAETTTARFRKHQHHHHDHNAEGRFQFFFFPAMDVVQTYVPNNGTKEESFQRRRDWDRDMLRFVRERNQILQAVSQIRRNSKTANTSSSKDNNSYWGLDRKFLWCGDMNVAATYRDGSHWEKRRPKQNETNNIDVEDGTEADDKRNCGDDGECVYEWFRDESKCLSRFGDKKKKKGDAPPPKLPENIGIPGFTPAERERFALFLEEGNFCDVWRTLHPEGVVAVATASSDKKKNDDGDDDDDENRWERPNYTWRGALAKNFGGYAKYQGKGQRIDYFLLSSKLGMDEIETCEIRGYGTDKDGLFCGSDHCAVELRFKNKKWPPCPPK